MSSALDAGAAAPASSPASALAMRPAFPVAVALIGIAAALAAFPFLAELPVYLEDAQRLAQGARLPAGNFYPVGYSLLLAPFVAALGTGGVVLLQAALYLATVWLAWHIVAREARLGPAATTLATLLVAFHPYLLLNILRVEDNAVNAPLVLLLCLWMLRGCALPRIADAVLYGLALGLFGAIRPNAVVFAALPLCARLLRRAEAPSAARLAWCYGAFAALWVAVSLLATGHPLFWPGNGPYNLFAGNNPLAAGALLSRYNGEYSIDAALAHYGLAGADRYTLPGGTYLALVWRFLREAPGQALALLGLKTVILLGPRWDQATDGFRRVVQLLLVYPVVLWIVATLVDGIRRRLRESALFLAFVALYLCPFLATNVDPRFRLPLDLAFILHGICRLWPRARAGAAAGAP
jgi:hypothetical protein